MFSSSTGIVLLDSSLNLIAASREAVRILVFPRDLQPITNIAAVVRDKIFSLLALPQTPGSPPAFVAEFRSGNRRYGCAAYTLEAGISRSSSPAMVLLLQRLEQTSVDIRHMAAQFHLTPRELETVEHLVRGLTTKEIAERMNVSPSTVNAFLRLVMVKVGVSNRSAVVHRILRPQARAARI